METLKVLKESFFNGDKGEAVYVYKGNQYREPLVSVSKIGLKVQFKLLNPLQTCFFRFYKSGNCLVSSPTSSGKTLVALLFRSLNSRGRLVYAAPTRSLIWEKFREFKSVFGSVGVRTGDLVEDLREITQPVVVATYESVLSAARSKSRWFEEAGAIVIDEVHMVMDATRGGSVEEIVSYALSSNVPLLALSATVPGALDLAKWIGADLFIDSDWRPVPLERKIFNMSNLLKKVKRKFGNTMPERMVAISEHLELSGKTILFVPKKDFGWKAIEIENGYLEKEVVNETVPFEKLETSGEKVAFHNADVPQEEREKIEREFKDKDLNKLYATQTLAYGVNLPADNVLIFVKGWFDRFSMEYKFFPDILTVLQMEGRAGRFGFSKKGYSFIVVSGSKEKNFEEVLELEMRKPFETALSRGLFREGAACGNRYKSILSLMMLGPILRLGDNWKKAVESMFSVKRNPFLLREIDSIYRELESLGYIVNGRLTKLGAILSSSFTSPFCYSEFLERLKKVKVFFESSSERASYLWSFTVRPLIRREFSSSTVNLFTNDAFKDISDEIRSYIVEATEIEFDDNSEVFAFYASGGFLPFQNVARPPGEFSFLKPESSLLAMLLARVNVLDFDTLQRVVMMVRTGISFKFSLLGSVGGLGYMRGNVVARAAEYCNINNEIAILNAIRERDRDVLNAIVFVLDERYKGKDIAKKREFEAILNAADKVKYPLGDLRLLRFLSSVFVGRRRALKLEKEECIDILHSKITGAGGEFEGKD